MFNSSLFGQWIQTSGPEGSYVHELERVNNEIWAATQSGLFISENEGLTWQKADFLPPEYSVRNIIVDGDEILLSTGLYDFNFPQFFPFKFNLLRSTDAGLTWTSKRMPVETFGNYYFYYDEIMVLHKSDNYLFVSYRGRDIYRSADLGDTWEEISSPPSIGASAFSGDKILATNSVYCYLSIDAGDTWETLDAEGSSGGLLFEDDLIMIETVNDFIYISNDLGASSISVPSTGYVFNETKFRRGNSGKIYLMGDRSFISEDDGLTWERLNDFSFPAARGIDVIERNDGSLLVGSTKGMFLVDEDDLSWTRTSTHMVGTEVLDMDALPNGDLLANTNIGYFRSPNQGGNWFSYDFPFGLRFGFDSFVVKGDSVIAHRNNNLLLSTDNLNSLDTIDTNLGFSSFRVIHRDGHYFLLGSLSFQSTDLMNWDSLLIYDNDNVLENYINDVVVTNDNVMLAVGDGIVYRSEDAGESWNVVLTFWAPGTVRNYLYKVGDRIFLVDNDDWFFSVDNGLTWNSASMTGLPPAEYDNKPRTFLSIGDNIYTIAGENEVHLSTDYGENWASISEGLDGYQGNHLFYANDQIYLGSISSGVWRRSTFFQSQGGLVFYDENNNGTKDIHESPLANVLVHSTPIDHFTRSRNDGVYIFYTETFNDTIRAIPPSPYATVQPDYYLSSQPTTTLDFAVSYIPNKDDLSINLTSYEPFRPGFDNQVDIMIKNLGTTTLSPIVKLPIPEELTFLEADISPTQVVDTLIWELPELPQFGSVKITVDFNVNLDNELGNWLNMEAEVFPIAEDQDPSNNRDNLTAQFVGSYDPNDKQVKPLGNYTPEQLANDEPLVYKVRFQNTGTYLAENVRIIDTLSEKLDISTFELVSASHPVEWNLRGPNVLEFVFQNIMLPDSASNLEASNGYVEFSIVPQKNLTLGDEIPNFADIYFDFNEPIRTNTSIATFDLSTGLKSLKLVEKTLYLSPNPAGDHCFISVEDGQTGNGLLSFYDGQGKLVLERKIEIGNSPKMIDLEKLTAGYYSVKFILGKEVYGGKLIKH